MQTHLIALAFVASVVPAKAQFSPASKNPFNAGHNPVAIVSADFNGDSIPDLAVANQTDNNVIILLGDGTGNFTAPATGPAMNGTFAAGTNPSSIAVADFNHDGKPDLAIANINSNNVTILLGDGAGGFAPPPGSTPPVTGQGPTAIAVADFNGDGNMDIAVANLDDQTVTILFGDGTGSFPTRMSLVVGKHPIAMVVADLNADGVPDLAVANEDVGTVTVFIDPYQNPNQTPLTLTSAAIPTAPAVTQNISAIVAANFTGHLPTANGSAYLDLAVTYYGTTNFQGNLILFVANEQGAYSLPSAPYFSKSFGSQPIAAATSYFDLSGLPGVAIANYHSNNVAVYTTTVTQNMPNMQNLTAFANSPYATGSLPRAIAVADFNGDGLSDVALANYDDGTVTVLLNAFATTPAMVSAASGTAPVAVGSLASIYGTGLMAPNNPTATAVTLTDSSGVQLSIKPTYTAATQLNLQVPPSAATGIGSFTVTTPAGSPQRGTIAIMSVVPGLFSAGSSGKGPACGFAENLVASAPPAVALFTCSSSTTCAPQPIDVSSGTVSLLLYGTGIGNSVPLSNVSVMVGGVPLSAFYAGPVPGGAPGLDQVNVALPGSLAHAGTVFVQVVIGALTSNQVTIAIQ